jgi:hypothetical protein
MKNNKKIHIFSGGTVFHVANHLALSAPAYGETGKKLVDLCKKQFNGMSVINHPTKMAGGDLETNEDVQKRVAELVGATDTKVIFFNCALVDWDMSAITVGDDCSNKFGKYTKRLESSGKRPILYLKPAEKIVNHIRKDRKDIFLVAFKTTCGASKQEMYEKGLNLCKKASANLVLVNDTKTRWNMIVTPEEAAYGETDDRDTVLKDLVEMAYYRSHLTFTRSTVVDGKPVSWHDDRVPESLRVAVDYCIKSDAYKPFNGSTVGHFAVKLSGTEFLTSIRRTNFNKLSENGLVYVKTDGPDTVLAYGAKPSVGGQSQRIIFKDHVGYDCVLHFHSPLKDNHKDDIPIRSQREVECGSHQCGKSTSDGLKQFGNLKAVMLDNHGPNIIFNKNIDPQEVIDFIDANFDLSKKTGGYNITETSSQS